MANKGSLFDKIKNRMFFVKGKDGPNDVGSIVISRDKRSANAAVSRRDGAFENPEVLEYYGPYTKTQSSLMKTMPRDANSTLFNELWYPAPSSMGMNHKSKPVNAFSSNDAHEIARLYGEDTDVYR